MEKELGGIKVATKSSSGNLTCGPQRKILALDLGTKTGVALKTSLSPPTLCLLDLSENGKFSNTGFRKFGNFLSKTIKDFSPTDCVVVEKAHVGKFFRSSEILFGLSGIVRFCCEKKGIQPDFISALTIKKFWTGSGKSKKPAMLEQTRKSRPEISDHNVSDAYALLELFTKVRT